MRFPFPFAADDTAGTGIGSADGGGALGAVYMMYCASLPSVRFSRDFLSLSGSEGLLVVRLARGAEVVLDFSGGGGDLGGRER